MKSFLNVLIGCGLAIGMTQVQAEELTTFKEGKVALVDLNLKPTLSGKTMTEIESMLGTPDRKIPAIGQPPITRWQYANQTVYFEMDRVIHSVQH